MTFEEKLARAARANPVMFKAPGDGSPGFMCVDVAGASYCGDTCEAALDALVKATRASVLAWAEREEARALEIVRQAALLRASVQDSED